jgi:phage head maturation protease
MTQRTDGGPAFPVGEEALIRNLQGATLRDYFAAKAMQGVLASDADVVTLLMNHADRAEFAYNQADAMLKARES